MEQNFQQTVLSELQFMLRPLAEAAESEDLRNDLFRRLGWDIDQVDGFPIASLNTALTQFAAGYQGLAELIEHPPEGIEGLADTLTATEHVVLGAIALSRVFQSSGAATPQGFEKLGSELINYLSTQYLFTRHPFTFHLLYLLTVIDDVVPAATLDPSGALLRRPRVRRALRLGQIPKLLSDPVGTLKAEYGLTNGITDPDATADKLFPRLLFFAGASGANASYGLNPAYQVDFDFGPGGNQLAAHMLTVFWQLPDDGDTGTVGFGTGIALSSELGVVLRPLGTFDVSERLGGWLVTLQGIVQAEGVAVDSSGVTVPDGSGGIKLHLEAVPPGEPDENGAPVAFLVGSAGGTRLRVGEFLLALDANLAPGAVDYGFQIEIRDAAFVISSGDGDGFLREVLPSEMPIEFDLAIGWSKQRGLHFSIGAGLQVALPVHVSLGGVLDIDTIELAIRTDGSSVDLLATATFTAHLGSVIDATAQQTGVKGLISFPSGDDEPGNLGPLDFDLDFQLPRGIGVAVHAGPVTGGGFIFLDPEIGRYSGALQLSVFGVGVKAFGLVDTLFPDGSSGFSFVIVIVAEFTPIQLGFGFTLVGVGGLIGVHRTVDAAALGVAARTGSLAHLLFPKNPVADAPAIIHDLSTVFPPARGHYIVGPMAKLGWGTPTLITADLGLLLEFPGPRIAIVGVVRMQLPSPEFVILSLQLAVAGLLDFPAKLFSLDAGLYDSYVAGYAVTGDMAYRLGFGSKASFLLSVGGFNTGFAPPPKFPALRPVSVDLGVNGNPSLTASGYFALTSNTAQIGARIELRASGYGIRLNGWLGFDVLFVFSPFSFVASISAGMRVSFHGVGIGVTLHGSLSGPTPWHVNGRVCVSVLWWDACLPVDVTFGRSRPAALPELDPWVGTGDVDDPRVEVLGLREAVLDARNWSGSAPPAGFSVVTLADAAEERTPIDPLGSATLRQKVAPLNQVLEKFGEYRPKGHDHFDVSSVRLNDVDLNGDGVPDQVPFEVVKDDFAPAHFSELSSAQKLSSDSYEPMDAGVAIMPNVVRSGAAGSQVLEYETAFITGSGETIRDLPTDARFKLTHEQLLVMLERSASALGGIRVAGTQRYNLPLDRPKKISLAPRTFVIADACSLTPNSTITPTGTTRSKALLALRAHVRSNPDDARRFTIVPVRKAA